MRSTNADRLSKIPAGPAAAVGGDGRRLCAGPTYLERLGVLYMDEIRLTIVMELHMREMGPRQFFETIGGTSYDSIRRHFLKLVQTGWLRKVRTVATGRGRPESLYRSTEQAVIDTETWGTIPVSIRDAFTVMLLEEMGSRLGEALEGGTVEARQDRIATFQVLEIDELAWCKAHAAVERCFQTLGQEQIDAKIRLEGSDEQPRLMIVNLGAFEAPGDQVPAELALPKVRVAPPPARWPHRIGKVFSDRLDLAIIEELNRAYMTPAQLQETLGGLRTQGFLRRCKRLKKLGWVVSATESGGPNYGANVYTFRAAAPSVSAQEIIDKIPASLRTGPDWEAFEDFIKTSVGAVDVGAFNSRADRHLTLSPLLVDDRGWRQVIRAIETFEETLTKVAAEMVKRRRRSGRADCFPAGFLATSYQSPFRDVPE